MLKEPLATDLIAILSWLATSGGAAIWMQMVSDWIRNEREGNSGIGAWLNGLKVIELQGLVVALSFIPPIAAILVLHYVPLGVLERASDYWAVAVGLLLAYLNQQRHFRSVRKVDSDRPSEPVG